MIKWFHLQEALEEEEEDQTTEMIHLLTTDMELPVVVGAVP